MTKAQTPAGAAAGERALDGRPAMPMHRRCAAAVVALALASLAGWATHIPLLTTLVPGRPSMSPMTAVLLLLSAAAVWALPARRHASRALGLAVAVAGVAIVVAHQQAWVAGPSAWWSSQLTGAAFVVSGLASALLAGGRAVAGQLTAFVVLLCAALLGIGHLFPGADLYRKLPGTGVAVPTVLAFIALSLGQLMPMEGHGFSLALSRRNTVGLLATQLLLGSVAATLLVAIPAVHALRRGLFDAETAVLLVAWGAMVLLGGTIWALAVAVDRAQAAAAAAEQSREDVRRMVAAAITHDLRSPLQTAVLSAHVLARLAQEEPRAAATVVRLQRSHRRLDRLLRSLLDGLSMDAGRSLPLQPSEVVLDELVRDVAADNDGTLAARLVVEGTARGWWDRDALFRVVENLLLNAVKYGERESQIRCHIEQGASGVRLVVVNQGPSIPPHEWETIFEPFKRGSVQGADAVGWGVGLAYARSVAASHGGWLRVLESGASGTRFELWLPAAGPVQPVR